MTEHGDNRLPVLAAEIRKAHADVQDAAKTAAERAIAAGHALIEAKGLVKHGEWLPWLREHCALPERTAQLYMKIAKSGQPPEMVAALGLDGAAKTIGVFLGVYDPFSDHDADAKRDLLLFGLFLTRERHWYPDHAQEHAEWIARGPSTIDDWLTGTGVRLRRTWGMKEPSEDFIASWLAFRDANAGVTIEDIDRQMAEVAAKVGPAPISSERKRRRKRKSATVADLEVAP